MRVHFRSLRVDSAGMAATLLPAASLKREILSGYFRCRLITKPALYRTIALAASQSRPVNAGLVTQIKKMIETVRDDFLWPQIPGSQEANIHALPAHPLNGTLQAAEEMVL